LKNSGETIIKIHFDLCGKFSHIDERIELGYIYKNGDIKMDMWTVINGLIYLLAFGLIGWVLLDSSRVSKKRG